MSDADLDTTPSPKKAPPPRPVDPGPGLESAGAGKPGKNTQSGHQAKKMTKGSEKGRGPGPGTSSSTISKPACNKSAPMFSTLPARPSQAAPLRVSAPHPESELNRSLLSAFTIAIGTLFARTRKSSFPIRLLFVVVVVVCTCSSLFTMSYHSCVTFPVLPLLYPHKFEGTVTVSLHLLLRVSYFRFCATKAFAIETIHNVPL